MNRHLIFKGLLILSFFTALQSCSERASTTAYVLKEGYIDCFPEGLSYSSTKNAKGSKKPRPVTAEISGVAYYHNRLILLNDKPIPGTTPLMTIPYDKAFIHQRIKHIGNENVRKARKLEDVTLSPDLKYMFMITAFNRINNKNFKRDSYNMLFYRKLQDDLKGYDEVVDLTLREGYVSSLPLRKKIKKALKSKIYPDGPPYFKVEAIAAIPGNRLLIGIRAMGKSYKKFNYTITIIGATYALYTEKEKKKPRKEWKEHFHFTGSGFKVLYRFNPYKYEGLLELPIGLSSMEYDFFNDRLLLLTSYENNAIDGDLKVESDEDVGGYLWSLPMQDFELNLPPELVMEEVEQGGITKKRPLHFAHKAEGITVLDPSTVFIIHDDDRRMGRAKITNPRTQFSRKHNQAAYSIVRFY